MPEAGGPAADRPPQSAVPVRRFRPRRGTAGRRPGPRAEHAECRVVRRPDDAERDVTIPGETARRDQRLHPGRVAEREFWRSSTRLAIAASLSASSMAARSVRALPMSSSPEAPMVTTPSSRRDSISSRSLTRPVVYERSRERCNYSASRTRSAAGAALDAAGANAVETSRFSARLPPRARRPSSRRSAARCRPAR